MQAIVKAEPKRGAQLQEVPAPGIDLRDALVRVRVASICGADLHI
jgi:threonine 3-dehydrogenase